MDAEVTGSRGLPRALELMETARSVTVLTGAGISTASGIPDFRGPNGVWTRNPEAQRMAHIDAYRSDPDLRVRSWQSRAQHPAWSAEPNAAHRAFVDLQEQGRLRALVTQNIDGLHQKAGSDPDLVLEVHGTMFGTECLACGDRGEMSAALKRVAEGEQDPPCLVCGGILKSATISFGQNLDPTVLERSSDAARRCDVFLAAGTSLTVYPIAGLVDIALARGCPVIICNGSPTPYDEVADAVLDGDLIDVLPALVVRN